MIDHSINLLEYLHKLALEPDADSGYLTQKG